MLGKALLLPKELLCSLHVESKHYKTSRVSLYISAAWKLRTKYAD